MGSEVAVIPSKAQRLHVSQAAGSGGGGYNVTWFVHVVPGQLLGEWFVGRQLRDMKHAMCWWHWGNGLAMQHPRIRAWWLPKLVAVVIFNMAEWQGWCQQLWWFLVAKGIMIPKMAPSDLRILQMIPILTGTGRIEAASNISFLLTLMTSSPWDLFHPLLVRCIGCTSTLRVGKTSNVPLPTWCCTWAEGGRAWCKATFATVDWGPEMLPQMVGISMCSGHYWVYTLQVFVGYFQVQWSRECCVFLPATI